MGIFFECFVYFWDSIKLGGAGLARPVTQERVEVFVAGFQLWLVRCNDMLEFSFNVFRRVVSCDSVCGGVC